MIILRTSRPTDGTRVIEIWRQAVDATHHFLTKKDRAELDEMVCNFLPSTSLWLAVNPDDKPLAFMLLDNSHMQALFVDPTVHSQGIGTILIQHGLTLFPEMTTDVNEQNVQAVGFYERKGFKRIGLSLRDEQGRPYPIIHLKYAGN
jgi:putative acetyltransferase